MCLIFGNTLRAVYIGRFLPWDRLYVCAGSVRFSGSTIWFAGRHLSLFLLNSAGVGCGQDTRKSRMSLFLFRRGLGWEQRAKGPQKHRLGCAHWGGC
jgi:hypothetical protein